MGGPATLFCDTTDEAAFVQALGTTVALGLPRRVIGGGTNLVVADSGFDGVVLRFSGAAISIRGTTMSAQSGAILQDVVDSSIAAGLCGMQTMTGIPGFLGGAVYGNAGAYGQSIQERVTRVRFTEGQTVMSLGNPECEFRYRESIFKNRKEWVILSADLAFGSGDRCSLAEQAREIKRTRDAKYPPSMKCAGSIFKNVFFRDLPERARAAVPAPVVREGKVPSAWFLEQVGAKGMRRGDIQVADYHANLIYNDGHGTCTDLVEVIQDLKRRVYDRFGFELEEEVQYVGFEFAPV
jgi:UDP-N-acetylmuramate dehydrogenase